jgi:hypothetical protein
MQRGAFAALSVLVLVLASASPADAARGTRRQCRQTCGPRIAQDCAPFRKQARRACRRAILRSCRRVSLDSCFLTPATMQTTTTTTTSLASTTTEAPSTTTTTTSHLASTTIEPTTTHTPTTSPPPTTTTTTLYHYGGDWTFFGDLVSDDCPGEDPSFLDAEVLVSHDPGASGVGVGVELFPALYGTADAAGFDASNDFPDDDCTVRVAFAAEVTPNPDLMVAALAIGVDCPESSCTVLYTGDLER